jgi:hypothetical protein
MRFERFVVLVRPGGGSKRVLNDWKTFCWRAGIPCVVLTRNVKNVVAEIDLRPAAGQFVFGSECCPSEIDGFLRYGVAAEDASISNRFAIQKRLPYDRAIELVRGVMKHTRYTDEGLGARWGTIPNPFV